MAPYTYYYCVSLILVYAAVLIFANLLLLRLVGKTTFGLSIQPDTAEHKKVAKSLNNRNIAIAVLVLVVLTINLGISFVSVIRLNTEDAHSLAVFAPIFTFLFFILMVFIGVKRMGNYTK